MTMPYSPSRAVYEGNDAATRFPFSFKVWDATQLVVTLTAPDGATTEASGWTADIEASGGEIVYLHNGASLPSGWKLAITRNMPFTQEVNLVSASRFDPQVIEDALDQATAERQQVKEMLGRAVIVPATSDETPQDVVQDVYSARDEAEASAATAVASETAAAASATKSAAQALFAQQSREQACQYADRAEQARDVAIQQSAAFNVVMAAETAQINTIIAINKDDQTAAITASRAWSETDEDVPVDTDEEGNPEYSSKHWALKSAQLLAGNASTTHKGVMQVGSGLDVDAGIVSAKVATTTERGIGRVATLADMASGAVVANGPAMISAGSEVERLLLRSADKYNVGEFYYFRHPTLKPGFAPAHGGLITGLHQGRNITEYPIWAYLQTSEGQLLCVTESQWQTMVVATWATLLDGSKVGWNGIGGAPFFVQNLAAGTLRMPDIRGMYAEAAGFNSLTAGGVRGDTGRDAYGRYQTITNIYPSGLVFNAVGADTANIGGSPTGFAHHAYEFRLSYAMPTGPAFAPRHWGALACAYLGQPAS